MFSLVARSSRARLQIKIVSGQIVCWPFGQVTDLRGLQGGLDNAGDAERHLILKIEDVLERTVEAVGPKMRAVCRVDQLRGDAHPTACFSYRAFEHIADAELAADLLH